MCTLHSNGWYDKRIHLSAARRGLPIYKYTTTSKLLQLLSRVCKYLSHSSLLWKLSESICAQPPPPRAPPHTHTHTLAARSKSQKAMHCQVELGQYYNSQCVSEGLCVVIHFRSWECSNRARSLWIKCLPCPSLFTETHAIWLLRFNTHERIRALAKNCTEVSLNVALAGLDVAWLFA